MSTVLWVNLLAEGRVTSVESDLWALYRYADRIDGLCQGAGVAPLSRFHDHTDVVANLGPEAGIEEVPDTYALMAEQGQWFPPAAGLAVVTVLIANLRERPVRFGKLTNHYDDVRLELQAVRDTLERAELKGARFHLCVVA